MSQSANLQSPVSQSPHSQAKSLFSPDYAARLSQCIHCGLCLSACPTYNVLGTEMDAPRGRIAIMRAASAGHIPLSEPIGRHVYNCLGCQSCRVACPSGVRTDEIFAGAKKILSGTALFPAPLAELDQRVRATHNIAGEPAVNRLLWQANLDVQPPSSRPAEVVLFTGCVSALYPMAYSILQSMVAILERARVDYTILGADEWCCGYPLLAAGLPIDDLMDHNVQRLHALGVKKIVTTCPSCYHTWKYDYPPDSFEVLHAVEFLADMAATGQLRLNPLSRRVTYHDPCDLGRKSKIYDAPRRLLESIPDIELVEMKSNRDNALCCGGGGNLESVDAALVQGVAKLRLEQALAVQAETIVSACQQCERTLAMAARRERARVRVMDLAQLVAQALDGNGESQ